MRLIISNDDSVVNYFTINPPESYQVELQMAISIVELSNKKYGMWDNGIAYDTNILRINSLIMSPADQKSFSDILNDNCIYTMTLDMQTDIGVFPAGPQHGDAGTFTLKLLNRDTSEWLDDPYGMFRNTFEFTVIPNQVYTMPTLRSEGNLTIGSITGLRYPAEGFQIRNKYNYEAISGKGNNASGINDGVNVQECNFELVCNSNNAANVVNYLSGEYGRLNEIDLISQSNYYSFGVENGSSGTYKSKLVKNSIVMNHETDDVWSIPLSFWKAA